MRKDDVVKLLRDSANLVESKEFSHGRITALWVQANCIKQNIEYMLNLTKKRTDNENQVQGHSPEQG
jgi:hypothetical protein